MKLIKKLFCLRAFLIIGFTFIFFSCTLVLISCIIPQWMIIYADASEIPSAWNQYNRTRGMFQECMEKNYSKAPYVEWPYIVNQQQCFEIDIGQYYNSSIADSNHQMIIKMRQSHIGLHGISIIILLIIMILGLGVFIKWCFTYDDSLYYLKWRIALSVLSFVVFLCLSSSCSIATALYVEVEKLPKYRTKYLPYSQFNLSDNVKFGPILYIAWISVGLCLIAAISFIVSSCLGKEAIEDKDASGLITEVNPKFSNDIFKDPLPIILTPSLSTNSICGIHAHPRKNCSSITESIPRHNLSNVQVANESYS